MKFDFADLTIKQAMSLIPAQNLTPWPLATPPKPPSDVLTAYLGRMQSFELSTSEAAKISLIDPILLEVVPQYPNLKVWKAEPLEAETVFGVADFLIAPTRAYVETPLLCAIEANRDDLGSEILVSGLFTTEYLPKLLGVLDLVCSACAQNVPSK